MVRVKVDAQKAVRLARKRADNDSSRLALADAVACYDRGDLDGAIRRARTSLAHSAGIFSADYKVVDRMYQAVGAARRDLSQGL